MNRDEQEQIRRAQGAELLCTMAEREARLRADLASRLDTIADPDVRGFAEHLAAHTLDTYRGFCRQSIVQFLVPDEPDEVIEVPAVVTAGWRWRRPGRFWPVRVRRRVEEWPDDTATRDPGGEDVDPTAAPESP